MRQDQQQLVDLVRDDLLVAIAMKGLDSAKARKLRNLAALGFREQSDIYGRDVDYRGLAIACQAVAEKIDSEDAGVILGHGRGSMPVGRIMMGLLRIGEFARFSDKITWRRQELADHIWNGNGPTPQTIAKYQPELCRHFAQALVESSADPLSLSPKLKQAIIRPDAPSSDFSRVWQESTFFIDPRRVIYRVKMRMQLLANIDGVDSYAVWHEYFNDPRPGVISTSASDRADIIEQRDDSSGGHVTYLKTLAPMKKNEVREIGLTTHVNSNMATKPRVQGEFVDSRGFEPSVFQVVFDLEDLPEAVWWFRKNSGHKAYEKPEDTDLPIESDGYVRAVFEKIGLGEVFGISWRWND